MLTMDAKFTYAAWGARPLADDAVAALGRATGPRWAAVEAKRTHRWSGGRRLNFHDRPIGGFQRSLDVAREEKRDV